MWSEFWYYLPGAKSGYEIKLPTFPHFRVFASKESQFPSPNPQEFPLHYNLYYFSAKTCFINTKFFPVVGKVFMPWKSLFCIIMETGLYIFILWETPCCENFYQNFMLQLRTWFQAPLLHIFCTSTRSA